MQLLQAEPIDVALLLSAMDATPGLATAIDALAAWAKNLADPRSGTLAMQLLATLRPQLRGVDGPYLVRRLDQAVLYRVLPHRLFYNALLYGERPDG